MKRRPATVVPLFSGHRAAKSAAARVRAAQARAADDDRREDLLGAAVLKFVQSKSCCPSHGLLALARVVAAVCSANELDPESFFDSVRRRFLRFEGSE